MKQVLLAYDKEVLIGGINSYQHHLKFTVVSKVLEDVDILQSDGVLQHGFRCNSIDSVSGTFQIINPLDKTIKELERLLSELKKLKE